MRTQCPSCQTLYNLADEHAGKNVKCKKCSQIFVVQPAAQAPATPVPPASAAPSPARPVPPASSFPPPMSPVPPPVGRSPAGPPPLGAVPPMPPSYMAPPNLAPHQRVPGYGVAALPVSPCTPRWGLAIATVSLLVLFLLFKILLNVESGQMLKEVEQVGTPDDPSYTNSYLDDDFDSREQRQNEIVLSHLKMMGTLGAGFGLAGLAFVTVYLCWVGLSYRNLPALRARQIRFSTAGSVGWHFCPLANLWQVPRILNDLWMGSDPKDRGRSHAIIQASVGLEVLAWCTGTVAQRMTSYSEIMGMTVIQLILDSIAVALLCVVIITITMYQDRRRQGLEQATRLSPTTQPMTL